MPSRHAVINPGASITGDKLRVNARTGSSPVRAAIAVSVVRCATDTGTREVKVGVLLDAIRTGRWREPIEEIRSVFHSNNGDRKTIDRYKQRLPAILFSGTFKRIYSNPPFWNL